MSFLSDEAYFQFCGDKFYNKNLNGSGSWVAGIERSFWIEGSGKKLEVHQSFDDV